MLEIVLSVLALGLAVLSLVFRDRQHEALALAVILLAVLHIISAAA